MFQVPLRLSDAQAPRLDSDAQDRDNEAGSIQMAHKDLVREEFTRQAPSYADAPVIKDPLHLDKLVEAVSPAPKPECSRSRPDPVTSLSHLRAYAAK